MGDRLNILDIWVDPVDEKEALTRVQYFLEKGKRPHVVFASNPEKNFSVPQDTHLYEIYKNADLLLPDGIGMVMAARFLHGVPIKRVAGADFFITICKLAVERKYKIFIYGAKEEVNKRAVLWLEEKYPGIQIVGRANGYVKDSEMPELINQINKSKAEILFIALGSPKQEKWFANNKDFLTSVKLCQCIGGTLDTIAGNVKRAPIMWQKTNLEWFYRLLAEPKRIGRQKVLPIFAINVIKEAIKMQIRIKG